MEEITSGGTQSIFGGTAITNYLELDCTQNIFGGTAINNHLKFYCTQNIFSGIAISNYLELGCTQNIFGGTARNNYLYAGCIQNIFGAIAISNYLEFDCTQNISGGTAINNAIRSGVQNISNGVAVSTILDGIQNIYSSGIASDVYIEGGGCVQNVYSGGLLVSVGVANFGHATQNIYGTVSSVFIDDVNGEVVQNIYSGGLSLNTITDGYDTYNSSSSARVNQNIYNGGIGSLCYITGGTIQVFSGGYAEDYTLMHDTSEMYVHAGGSAHNVTVFTYLSIASGGSVSNIYAYLGNVYIHHGAFVSNFYLGASHGDDPSGVCAITHIYGTAFNNAFGGHVYVYSGSVVSDSIIEGGAKIHIMSGAVMNDNTIYHYAKMFVHSGGIANSNQIGFDNSLSHFIYDINGWLEVSSGGTAIHNSILQSLAFLYGGVMLDTVVVGGDLCIVSGSAMNNSITGIQFNDSLWKTGFMKVFAGSACNNYIGNLGSVYVSSGGYIDNTIIDSSGALFVYSNGQAIGNTVLSGGSVTINNNGFSMWNTINRGATFIVNNATVVDNMIGSGANFIVNGGTVANSIISYGANFLTNSWIKMLGNTIYNPLTIVDGDLIENDIWSILTVSNTNVTCNIIRSGGVINVSDGGKLHNNGICSGATINVYSGGSAGFNTIDSGGELNVFSSGIAYESFIDGTLHVHSGGATNGNMLSRDGVLLVAYGGVARTNMLLGSCSAIINGGVAIDNEIYNGTFVVTSGGTALNNSIDGDFHVVSGGFASNTNLRSGAAMHVTSGIVKDVIVCSDGVLNLGSGAVLQGTAIISGAVNVMASANVSAADIIFDLYSHNSPDDYIVNNLDNLFGANSYSVGFAYNKGDYKLAQNAGSFDNVEFSVWERDENITVNGERVTFSDRTFQLILDSNDNLILRVQGMLEIPSLTVTTSSDIVDSYDEKISLREAMEVYAPMLVSSGSAIVNFAVSSGTFIAGSMGYDNITLSGNGSSTKVNYSGSMIKSGEILNITNALVYSATLLPGGELRILSQGTAENCNIFGGNVYIDSGGFASNTVVKSEATMHVTCGTVKDILICSDGVLNLGADSILQGTAVFAGSVVVTGTVNGADSTVVFDLTNKTSTDGLILNDMILLEGADYSVKVTATQADGRYVLAGNATISKLDLTVGNSSDVYTIDTLRSAITVDGYIYSLYNTGGSLELNVAGPTATTVSGATAYYFSPDGNSNSYAFLDAASSITANVYAGGQDASGGTYASGEVALGVSGGTYTQVFAGAFLSEGTDYGTFAAPINLTAFGGTFSRLVAGHVFLDTAGTVTATNLNIEGDIYGTPWLYGAGVVARANGDLIVRNSFVEVNPTNTSADVGRVAGGGRAESGANIQVDNVEVNINGGSFKFVSAGSYVSKTGSAYVVSGNTTLYRGTVDCLANGGYLDRGASASVAKINADTLNLTINGGAITGTAFGGAFSSGGKFTATETNFEFKSGYATNSRIYAGSYLNSAAAESHISVANLNISGLVYFDCSVVFGGNSILAGGGTANIGTSNIFISGSVRGLGNIYAGSCIQGSSNISSTIGTVNITVDGYHGTAFNIHATGQNSAGYETIGAVNLTLNGYTSGKTFSGNLIGEFSTITINAGSYSLANEYGFTLSGLSTTDLGAAVGSGLLNLECDIDALMQGDDISWKLLNLHDGDTLDILTQNIELNGEDLILLDTKDNYSQLHYVLVWDNSGIGDGRLILASGESVTDYISDDKYMMYYITSAEII